MGVRVRIPVWGKALCKTAVKRGLYYQTLALRISGMKNNNLSNERIFYVVSGLVMYVQPFGGHK